MANTIAATLSTEVTAQEVRYLTELPAAPSASIYMTMYRTGPEVRQNPVRLKNHLRRASERARTLGHDHNAALSLAAELTRMVDSVDELVAEPLDGLAIFARDGFTRIFKMPVKFNDLLSVSYRFHVTPLLEYLQGDGRFFVLAVSQKDVRLLEGDKHSIEEVEVDSLPKNLVDALNIDEWVQSLQFHTEAPGGRNSINNGGGIFHGHGGGGDQSNRKSDIMQFFRRLDNALANYFKNESAPLVFAGVDYLFPIYQSVNNYKHLASKPVTGNPEGWNAEKIHSQAWEVVKSQFASDRAAAVEQYGMLAARGQASDVLLQIIQAARSGRVGTLLVARGAQEFGVVNPKTGEASLADHDTPESEDLIALATSETIGTSGTVFLMEQSEMPTESPAAALYRY